ncbi:MAG: hypothetical protein K2X77_32570 [Candidatus Obscuribacterales bacterium]|nr:hypothetical protein [Candidatus Obscuribacterales bacterium]
MSNSLQPRKNAPIEIIGEFPSTESAERCVDSLNDTNVRVQDVTVWSGESAKMDVVIEPLPVNSRKDKGFILMALAISFTVLGLITTLAIMYGEPAWGFFKHIGAGQTALLGAVLGCMFGTLIGGAIVGSIREDEEVVYKRTSKTVTPSAVEPREYATEASIYKTESEAVLTPTPLSLVGKSKVLIDILLDEETYLKRISELMLKCGASKVTMRFAGA